MLKNLINKEIREIIQSTKFVISFSVCSLLIILTFYVGAKSYHVNKSQFDSAAAENLRGMEGVTDWRMIDHNISLPPFPLAFLVSGISNDIGRNIKMSGYGELTAKDSKYNEDLIYAAFRFLDLDFIFQVILSLFAVLLAYNSVNGEKELGTLRLIFSNSVPRDKYILAKILGSFLAVALPLLIPFLIGMLLLILLNVPFTSTDWLKLLLIISTGFLFFGSFITLSVFVSTLTKKSSNSFLFLLVTWILFVLVIPRASILLAASAVEVPSVDKLNFQKNVFANQLSEEHVNALKSFKSSGAGDVIEEFQKYMAEKNATREEKMNAFSKQLEEERNNRQNAQQDLSFTIARVSPAASFSFAVSNLAGTSLELIKNYRDQAKNYQKVFADFQIDKTGSTTTSGMVMVVRKTGGDVKTINPSELPKFNFTQPDLSNVLSASIIDIGLLAFFNILFFAGSFVTFLKYDLR
ncbi:MAG: hypothetical protein A2068_08785 [Ignavibacteria bacterium GWB2_35_6b]|nr:MAG: hypothetical protein A2068_08785 [Ignavibacteria bacterium GWB2_35_6b]